MDDAYSLSIKCNEFDEFKEFSKGWDDVDFKATSLAKNIEKESIHLYQSFSGLTLLSWARFNLGVDQRALTPIKMRTIAIPPPTHPDFSWCGKHICGEQILLFNKNRELESISQEGFEAFTVSVPESWLLHIDNNEQVISCNKKNISILYNKLSALTKALHTAKENKTEKQSRELQDVIVFEILSALFETSNAHALPCAKEQRIKVVGNALHLIHNTRKRLFISEICFYVKVSERTLERLFKDTLGISPKKYLNRFLMQEAYSLLKQAHPTELTVTDVMTQLGFSHHGQFTAEYYCHFNELPSFTLKTS